MGHKVNPLVFRLGNSNNWLYNFKEKKNWVTSYLIYQLVSNQFLKYTTPHFNLKKTRNRRNEQGLVIMRGEKQIVANPLVKKSILFSHINLGSYLNNNLVINCYFYDYGINFRNRVPKFVKYNQLFSNHPLKKYRRHPYWRQHIKFRGYPYRFHRWLKHMGQNYWLYNFRYRQINGISQHSNKLFILSLCWLRLSSKISLFNKKKKIFFVSVWSNLLMGIYPIIKTAGYFTLTRRVYLVISLLNLLKFSFKLNNSWFFTKQFRTRYYLFKSLSKSISHSIQSLKPDHFSRVTTKFNAIREKKMTSSLLTNLIIIKLGQYFRINSIIFPLTNWLRRHRDVLGYRIIISGRLTRRERASHLIKSYKRMPLSSYKERIDYYQDVKIMKFGMVGIKVYLFLREKHRNNYYFFKFVNKI